jgi:hypothetical protein
MTQIVELADQLGSLALFADLSRPEPDAAAHSFEETGPARVSRGHPLLDFAIDEHRRAVASLLVELGLAPAEGAQPIATP